MEYEISFKERIKEGITYNYYLGLITARERDEQIQEVDNNY